MWRLPWVRKATAPPLAAAGPVTRTRGARQHYTRQRAKAKRGHATGRQHTVTHRLSSDDYARLMPDVARRLRRALRTPVERAASFVTAIAARCWFDLIQRHVLQDHEHDGDERWRAGVSSAARPAKATPSSGSSRDGLIAPAARRKKKSVKLGPDRGDLRLPGRSGRSPFRSVDTLRARRSSDSGGRDDARQMGLGYPSGDVPGPVSSAPTSSPRPYYRCSSSRARKTPTVSGDPRPPRVHATRPAPASGGSLDLSPRTAGLLAAGVFVLPDNDDPGRAHAAVVARSLHGVAAKSAIVALRACRRRATCPTGSTWPATTPAVSLALCLDAKLHPADALPSRIVMLPGELVGIVSEAQRALIAGDAAIYQRGGELFARCESIGGPTTPTPARCAATSAPRC